MLQEGARVTAVSPQHLHPAGLALHPRANRRHQRGAPRALLLPQASGREADGPHQPDGGQGPQQQPVQRALHLPLPPLSRVALPAGAGQDVSSGLLTSPRLISHILQIFHAENYSILWCGLHQ